MRQLIEKYDRYSPEATQRRRDKSRERVAQWRIDNPDKYREQYLRYQRNNREKIQARARERRQRDPSVHRQHSRKGFLKKLGLTLKDREELFAMQGNKCAICLRTESEAKRIFCVDHCHATGKIRGILCNKCNTVLGMAKDDLEYLRRAIAYLGGVLLPTI